MDPIDPTAIDPAAIDPAAIDPTAGESDLALPVGVLRPGPAAPVVAVAEARVIEHELSARLGPLALDLRVDGDPIAGWQPRATAGWPDRVVTVVEPGRLWSAASPPLTILFGRTVEPAAAEVRRRMLTHLGLLPAGDFELDEARYRELGEVPLRPTDLWIIATRAAAVTVDDPAVRGFADTDPTRAASLGAAFDELAASLAAIPAVGAGIATAVARLTAERDRLRQRVAEAASELRRVEREAADRLDALEAERTVLAEQLRRAELQGAAAAGRGG